MVTVTIGSAERVFSKARDIDPAWINEQINRRRADGRAVCVRARVQTASARVSLATTTCADSGGGGRPPNDEERRILHLWNERGLGKEDFSGGNVVAFLQQLLRTFG